MLESAQSIQRMHNRYSFGHMISYEQPSYERKKHYRKGVLSRLDRIVGFLTTLNIDVNTAYVNKDIVSKNHKVHFFILQKLVEDVHI